MCDMYLALSKKLSRIVARHVKDGEANEYGFHVGSFMLDPFNDGREYVVRLLRMRKEMLKAGFVYVGHGHFSLALTHFSTPGAVFKFSFRTDDAYSAYALWVRDQPNAHAPKILNIYRGRVGVVYVLKQYAMLHDAGIHDFYANQFLECATKPRKSYHHAACTDDLMHFMRRIMEFFKGTATIDVHGENLMYDLDAQCIIITDPVSFSREGSNYASGYEGTSSECRSSSDSHSEGTSAPRAYLSPAT